MGDDNFWRHVQKTDGCWLWTASLNPNGYGQVRFQGHNHRAHRVAFFLTYGRWPTPCGLHRCDNRICVRQDHIFEGTHDDNVRDKIAKGRQRYAVGEQNGKTKLSDTQITEIRASSDISRVIGARFNIDRSYISRIKRGEARCQNGK